MSKKRSSLEKLLDYAGGYKKLTMIGCLLSGVAAVLALGPFICIWLVVRTILEVWPYTPPEEAVAYYGYMAVWLALGSIAIYFVGLMCTHIAAFRTARNMRQQAVNHVMTLPMGFFSDKQSGRLRKIIDDNASQTESLLAHQLPDLAGAVVTPVAAILLLLVFDWRMGLLSLLPMAAAIWLMGKMMGGENAGFFQRYQMALEKMSGEAVEYVRGIPVVKVFQQMVFSFKSFYAAIMSYRDLATSYALSCQKPMTAFTTVLNSTFLLLIPAGMVLLSITAEGEKVLLDWIFYILFTPACAMMINRIMYASQSLMEADEAIRKLNEILSVKPLAEPTAPQAPQEHSIAFRQVTFSYPGAEQPALKDISLEIKEGMTVAIVGPSGGGKTTTASLIPRFWDVDAGQVLIGGIDVRKMATEELMRQVAFVFQDTHLFKASLLDNIRAGRHDASREQVLQAAHLAQCDDILAKLPSGIDTVVGTEGIYLSGGECQRVALARAILKDAPIVLLDEATAFADPENEQQIQRAFEYLTRGKTVLIIAHRLSTIRHADQILVMDGGTIVERGRHEELMAAEGLYAGMWRDYKQSVAWRVGKEAVNHGA